MEVGVPSLRARVAGASGGGAEDRAPDAAAGPVGVAIAWLRRNLFSSPGNAVLTLAVLALLALAAPPFVEWSITQASFTGTSRSACGGEGACWSFIMVRLPLFFYGHYPEAELWRLCAVAVLMIGLGAQVLRENVRHRGVWLLMLLTVFPAVAAVLLVGGVPGLPYVDTNLWGGLMLDVVIAFVAVAGALPLGVLLALGRRSQLPIVRYLSVGFIEFWRGIPLLTVLFMAAVMVPLFLPSGVSVDRLLRAMVALILFNAAYMAETVRGGLQGVELGQEEAAYSVGLRWWQVQAFVVLPQALRHVMPGIVNNVVDLFKDTTLVSIIGLFDVLGAVNQALKDPAWLGFAKEGYVFTMVVFFACCFAMSSYARRMERRLNRHRTGRR